MPRTAWIVVGGTRVYLDPGSLAEGGLRVADADVWSESCVRCGEDILESGTVRPGIVAQLVTCTCGASYAIEQVAGEEVD